MIRTLKTNAGPVQVEFIRWTTKGMEVKNTAGHTACMARSRSGQTWYLVAGPERLTADELRRWLDGDDSAITARRAAQAERRKAWRAASAEALEKSKARMAELDKIADQPGWTMIAGEESEVLCTGTRAECYSALSAALHRLPRDPHEGAGAWSLLPPDGTREITGTFDQHCYYS